MSFDGITVHALTRELNHALQNGRIVKIAQPQPEELIITVKNNGSKYLLLMNANASLPLIYLTEKNEVSPLKAPGFLMLLRKYIGSGIIEEVSQPGLERVICIHIRHLDEMGDEAHKNLYIEIMGKYSNIIFTDDNGKILDSIKRVGANTSSVREVLPGRDYFIPAQKDKYSPFEITETMFYEDILKRPMECAKAISSGVVGFSYVTSNQLCLMASVDPGESTAALTYDDRDRLYQGFKTLLDTIDNKPAEPVIYSDPVNKKPLEFSAWPLEAYRDSDCRKLSSVSEMLYTFYASKNTYSNMKQRSADLRKNVKNLLERESKKLNIQEKQLKGTDKMDKYRLYGELLHTYGYSVPEGAKETVVTNYYTNEPLTIPLDPEMTAMECAEKYFNRYNKLKRTKEAVTVQIEETKKNIDQLDSILTSLDLAEDEGDLSEIKTELSNAGFIHKSSRTRKEKDLKAEPLHFVTEDGFDIFVGKNNFQNEFVTFKKADPDDWWFHAKKVPGSHVIVKSGGKELPDDVFVIAAQIAAYYSKGRDNEKTEVDYVKRKELKKTNGGAPGFVIYHTNFSMTVHPQVSGVKKV
ncbi:MAG: fibronectin/fibrinogen-binding protein [Lachnospiraceae bacterium]|uniref:Rqc2 homolog RqcH n=1 Tax=Candidatus Weimeria bifida TaxID=2599074 RepID=A0A6N7IYX5_9FIRM|nr:fibronectin/fibrinogen-binding protein [Candidatus Weimeria bifida]RRF96962.1 MAG: fibronectin/fibrinogen-binding protein [Lachnospiraceae bacterium]